VERHDWHLRVGRQALERVGGHVRPPGPIEPDVMIRTASGSTRRRDARVVVARGRAIAGLAVRRVTMIGRTLALVTERVDPSQQR